jgi:hypothetical protein
MFKCDSDGAEAMRKFEKSVESLVSDQDNATETRRPLKNWIY